MIAENKKYYPELDIVKGIAILLVILGHSFCTFPFDLNAQLSPIIGKVVRSFQMPLFFIASGFLFSRKENFKVFIRKKMLRLALPWLTFSILSVALRIIFSSFTHSGGINILDGLYDIIQGHYYWFLYALIVIMIICYIVKNPIIMSAFCLISVVCCLVTEIKDINAFTIGRIVYYFPFFCLGLFLKRFYRKIIDNKIISMILLCVFIISYAISIIWINSAGRAINFYVVTLSGSLLTWGIAIWLSQWKMSVFKHFGHYSLQYYLNHLLIMLPIYYIVNLIPVLPILQLLAIWIIATAISFIMLKIQLRFKILRLLCGIN